MSVVVTRLRVAKPVVGEGLVERTRVERDVRAGLSAAWVRLSGELGRERRRPGVSATRGLVVDAGGPIEIVVLNLLRDRLGADRPFFGSAVVTNFGRIADFVIRELLVLQYELKCTRCVRSSVVARSGRVVRG